MRPLIFAIIASICSLDTAANARAPTQESISLFHDTLALSAAITGNVSVPLGHALDEAVTFVASNEGASVTVVVEDLAVRQGSNFERHARKFATQETPSKSNEIKLNLRHRWKGVLFASTDFSQFEKVFAVCYLASPIGQVYRITFSTNSRSRARVVGYVKRICESVRLAEKAVASKPNLREIELPPDSTVYLRPEAEVEWKVSLIAEGGVLYRIRKVHSFGEGSTECELRSGRPTLLDPESKVEGTILKQQVVWNVAREDESRLNAEVAINWRGNTIMIFCQATQTALPSALSLFETLAARP